MNEHFTQFSEAAKLYARNWSVVELMSEAFQRDIEKFLNLVLDRAKAKVVGGHVKQDGIANRNWYIPREGGQPSLWIGANNPQIITSNTLTVEVRAEGALKPYQERLRNVLYEIPLSSDCSRAPGSGALLFKVIIKFSENEEMVAAVAEAIWTLLNAMDDEFRKIQQVK